MMPPNLDALAKRSPFRAMCGEVWPERGSQSLSAAELMAIANEWAELRKLVQHQPDGSIVIDADLATVRVDAAGELAELRAAVVDLRRWRSEHDCRYTLGAVADLDLFHCPIDNPCVRCQRRLEWDAAQKENAELRAYRERTEAALLSVCAKIQADMAEHELRSPAERSLAIVTGVMLLAGLWREPGQGAT